MFPQGLNHVTATTYKLLLSSLKMHESLFSLSLRATTVHHSGPRALQPGWMTKRVDCPRLWGHFFVTSAPAIANDAKQRTHSHERMMELMQTQKN